LNLQPAPSIRKLGMWKSAGRVTLMNYWSGNQHVAVGDKLASIVPALVRSRHSEKLIALAESKWSYAPDLSVSNSSSLATGRVLDETTYEFVISA